LLPLRIFRKEKTMETEFITAPRREMENQLHFSYSQLSTFILCGFKYAHQ
jgi:hypothetical protein